MRDGGFDCGGILGLPATTLGVSALLADADPSSKATSLVPVAVEEDLENGGPEVARMPSSELFSEEGSTITASAAFET